MFIEKYIQINKTTIAPDGYINENEIIEIFPEIYEMKINESKKKPKECLIIWTKQYQKDQNEINLSDTAELETYKINHPYIYVLRTEAEKLIIK